jgi:prevent-host-death family protein
MKTISAAEANRHFSEVLRQATHGATILITSRGRAVATLGPAKGQSKVRAAARSTLLQRLEKQKPSGKRNWTRADLYENER